MKRFIEIEVTGGVHRAYTTGHGRAEIARQAKAEQIEFERRAGVRYNDFLRTATRLKDELWRLAERAERIPSTDALVSAIEGIARQSLPGSEKALARWLEQAEAMERLLRQELSEREAKFAAERARKEAERQRQLAEIRAKRLQELAEAEQRRQEENERRRLAAEVQRQREAAAFQDELRRIKHLLEQVAAGEAVTIRDEDVATIERLVERRYLTEADRRKILSVREDREKHRAYLKTASCRRVMPTTSHAKQPPPWLRPRR